QPNSKDLRFTAGLFNRPFGYSIVYSSGYRDFPERARVFQTLMPRERDIGAMISYNPSKLKFISGDLAVVNGSGHTARDFDSKKDFIGNLGFKFDSLLNKKLHIGFGASGYSGSVRSDTESYFHYENGGYTKNTSVDNVNWYAKRRYYGFNLQLQYDNTFGSTSIKAEYVAGRQPGVASSSSVTGFAASTSFGSQPTTDLYLRDFSGCYIWVTQKIAKTKLTAIMAFDMYDPNRKISEAEVGLENNTSAGDIKFNTLGYGFTYLLNPRLKLTVYNEHVVNDHALLPQYTADLKDDVFTTRLQYRW
ncbi:MAG TPA: porin, partial [Pedobacter sp.]